MAGLLYALSSGLTVTLSLTLSLILTLTIVLSRTLTLPNLSAFLQMEHTDRAVHHHFLSVVQHIAAQLTWHMLQPISLTIFTAMSDWQNA